ncbi:Short chain dehydrogenase sol3 [Lasiodiplodia theobromae]|uniref:Short chain dehydrogenase sol3 n=1 Tax=Lasiodiplodia theobromae TaxID=45133 RepID=A0A5N5D082_9PEZI|nr:Short chain dehydrogenase sol3 [Lasiodiplodia theobromae]
MAPSVRVMHEFLKSQLCVTVPEPTTSFADRVVIVTGGNVGLGLETARTIARLGAAKVIISSRSTAKGEEARKSILESLPADENKSHDGSRIEVWPLDLCNHASVRAFAQRANALPRLDALICNAGMATMNFSMAEGHESTITTNVISTFLLSLLILPALKRTAAATRSLAHLVIVSSDVHFFTDFAERKHAAGAPGSLFAALRDEQKSDMMDRYNVSKLLEVFVVRELAALTGNSNNNNNNPYPVVISAPNPGFCTSELRREAYEGSFAIRRGMRLIEAMLERTTEEGARNFVHCAAAGTDYHGQYVSDGVPKEPAALVLSEEGGRLQKQVWAELRDILEGIEPGVTGNI